ncbi:MAG: HAD family hydrolase [Clostridiales bacterium]|jgi:phosphoglycolate phosphatase|nr:HAD family hydrolase [Clostridiales bacterium]
MYKAILFDLDGTLINSLDDLADSANYALKKLNYPVHETEKYKYFVGDGVFKLMERVLPEGKRTQSEIESLLEIYLPYYERHSFDKTKPYSGITQTLLKLREAGIKLAVVTNKPEDISKVIIQNFFGNSLFDTCLGSKSTRAQKPAPDIVFDTLRILGAEPSQTLFVGDTAVDMQTAANSGCVSAGALWGFRTEEELLNSGAKYIARTPEDLLSITAIG